MKDCRLALLHSRLVFSSIFFYLQWVFLASLQAFSRYAFVHIFVVFICVFLLFLKPFLFIINQLYHYRFFASFLFLHSRRTLMFSITCHIWFACIICQLPKAVIDSFLSLVKTIFTFYNFSPISRVAVIFPSLKRIFDCNILLGDQFSRDIMPIILSISTI